MSKKINCKHGLTQKQEIEARRLRRKIEGNDAETMTKIIKLREEWCKDNEHFLFIPYLLKKGDIVMASAILRITDEKIIHRIYFKK